MIRLRQILRPLVKQGYTRSALKILVPDAYYDKLRRWYRQEGLSWCAVVMYREFEQFVCSLDCPRIDTLEISGTRSQGRFNFRSYQSTTFPDYDICKGPLAQEKFDLVIAEQVFEHILRPDLAAAHVYQMLRPGGVFVINTPFLVKFHEVPLDLYRWTERGIRQLLETAGFTVLTTGSWGNLKCLFADMTPGMTWTVYNPRRHSLQNDPQFPIVIWAFAQKPN